MASAVLLICNFLQQLSMNFLQKTINHICWALALRPKFLAFPLALKPTALALALQIVALAVTVI